MPGCAGYWPEKKAAALRAISPAGTSSMCWSSSTAGRTGSPTARHAPHKTGPPAVHHLSPAASAPHPASTSAQYTDKTQVTFPPQPLRRANRAINRIFGNHHHRSVTIWIGVDQLAVRPGETGPRTAQRQTPGHRRRSRPRHWRPPAGRHSTQMFRHRAHRTGVRRAHKTSRRSAGAAQNYQIRIVAASRRQVQQPRIRRLGERYLHSATRRWPPGSPGYGPNVWSADLNIYTSPSQGTVVRICPPTGSSGLPWCWHPRLSCLLYGARRPWRRSWSRVTAQGMSENPRPGRHGWVPRMAGMSAGCMATPGDPGPGRTPARDHPAGTGLCNVVVERSCAVSVAGAQDPTWLRSVHIRAQAAPG